MTCRFSNMLPLCFATILLSSCGAWQKTKQGTASVAKAVFYRQVDRLHLTFNARAAINQDDAHHAMPLRLGIFQLSERQIFDNTEYHDLLTQPDIVLKESLVAQRQLSVMPGQSITLAMPMEQQAQFVAIVGLFRQPDRERGTWKRVLSRDDLDADTPRTIEVRDNTLNLDSLK
ncbi:type VI secretion system lipoprotein TssJ [Pantoea sp. BIGb0393]|uniref:Type VI secretion system lipoprotein TssJ n=1 Tax=Pantoea nemavictus TaxID=2726955 RepID=A0ABU8PVB3_9GAMM|nr:type VI secretion system lipoprotein TssJ [Pantoea nemavictus]MBA0037507.1 type VI secretion system lipoprotein TssJ [Pantoea nemavictus]